MHRDLPASWYFQFNGEALDLKAGVSAGLATVDAHAWPHLAFLSAGEVLVQGDRVALALWPGGATADDLRRDGRAILYAAADDAVWEVRLTCTEPEPPAADGLALFHGRLGDVRRHKAPYAIVENLIAFKLLDPARSVERWEKQIRSLYTLLSRDPTPCRPSTIGLQA